MSSQFDIKANMQANHKKYVLRVEDTDQERSTKESEEQLMRELEWLGLNADEGPLNPGDFD